MTAVTVCSLMVQNKLTWIYYRDGCREGDIDSAPIPLPRVFVMPEIGGRMQAQNFDIIRYSPMHSVQPSTTKADINPKSTAVLSAVWSAAAKAETQLRQLFQRSCDVFFAPLDVRRSASLVATAQGRSGSSAPVSAMSAPRNVNFEKQKYPAEFTRKNN